MYNVPGDADYEPNPILRAARGSSVSRDSSNVPWGTEGTYKAPGAGGDAPTDSGGGGSSTPAPAPKQDDKIGTYTDSIGNVHVTEDYTAQGGGKYDTVVTGFEGGYSGSGFERMGAGTLSSSAVQSDILAEAGANTQKAAELEKAGIITIRKANTEQASPGANPGLFYNPSILKRNNSPAAPEYLDMDKGDFLGVPKGAYNIRKERTPAGDVVLWDTPEQRYPEATKRQNNINNFYSSWRDQAAEKYDSMNLGILNPVKRIPQAAGDFVLGGAEMVVTFGNIGQTAIESKGGIFGDMAANAPQAVKAVPGQIAEQFTSPFSKYGVLEGSLYNAGQIATMAVLFKGTGSGKAIKTPGGSPPAELGLYRKMFGSPSEPTPVASLEGAGRKMFGNAYDPIENIGANIKGTPGIITDAAQNAGRKSFGTAYEAVDMARATPRIIAGEFKDAGAKMFGRSDATAASTKPGSTAGIVDNMFGSKYGGKPTVPKAGTGAPLRVTPKVEYREVAPKGAFTKRTGLQSYGSRSPQSESAYTQGIGYNIPDKTRVKSVMDILGAKDAKIGLEQESTWRRAPDTSKIKYFEDELMGGLRQAAKKERLAATRGKDKGVTAFLKDDQASASVLLLQEKPAARQVVFREEDFLHSRTGYNQLKAEEMAFIRKDNQAPTGAGTGGAHNPTMDYIEGIYVEDFMRGKIKVTPQRPGKAFMPITGSGIKSGVSLGIKNPIKELPGLRSGLETNTGIGIEIRIKEMPGLDYGTSQRQELKSLTLIDTIEDTITEQIGEGKKDIEQPKPQRDIFKPKLPKNLDLKPRKSKATKKPAPEFFRTPRNNPLNDASSMFKDDFFTEKKKKKRRR